MVENTPAKSKNLSEKLQKLSEDAKFEDVPDADPKMAAETNVANEPKSPAMSQPAVPQPDIEKKEPSESISVKIDSVLDKAEANIGQKIVQAPGKIKRVLLKTDELWRDLDNKKFGKALKVATTASLLGLGVLSIVATPTLAGIAGRAVLATTINMGLTESSLGKLLNNNPNKVYDTGWNLGKKELKITKKGAVELVITLVGLTIAGLSGGLLVAGIGAAGAVIGKGINICFDKKIKAQEGEEGNKEASYWTRIAKGALKGATMLAVGITSMNASVAHAEAGQTEQQEQPAPVETKPESTTTEKAPTAYNPAATIIQSIKDRIFGHTDTKPDSEYSAPAAHKLTDAEIKQTEIKTEPAPVSKTDAPEAPKTGANQHVVQAGDSISGKLAEQAKTDSVLAEKIGLHEGMSKHETALAYRHAMERLGFIDEKGHEIRLGADAIGKTSIEFGLDSKGDLVAEIKNEDGMFIHKEGQGFLNDKDLIKGSGMYDDGKEHHYQDGKEISGTNETPTIETREAKVEEPITSIEDSYKKYPLEKNPENQTQTTPDSTNSKRIELENDTGYTLSHDQYEEMNKIMDHNMRVLQDLLGDERKDGLSNFLKNTSASDIMEKHNSGMWPLRRDEILLTDWELSDHLNKLSDIAHLNPKNGFLGLVPEKAHDFIERALAKIASEGNLDKVKLKN